VEQVGPGEALQLDLDGLAEGHVVGEEAPEVIGDEGVPAAIIRGYKYEKSETSKATDLVRPRGMDLFI
jgi:F420-0:gamma-glutamyl ligase